jgi:hypothetical protein
MVIIQFSAKLLRYFVIASLLKAGVAISFQIQWAEIASSLRFSQ